VDEHERHHEHHEKEREQEKKEHKAHEHEGGGKKRPFHPAWYVVVGVVLCLVALLVWMFVLRA
jgi:ABC-type nickel/cobalt efflux system permease component RcnA